MKKTLAFTMIIAVMFLTACTPERIFIREEIPLIHPDKPAPVNMKEVEWTVWNYELVKEAAGDEANKDKVWFILDEQAIKNLGLNLTDILEYSRISKQNNEYYEKSINDYNQRVRESNQSK